jgi:predicted transcriptional regulator
MTDYGLTELQLEILQVLWRRREATVLDVQMELQPTRDLAQTTVATLLARMEKKGVIEHRTEGRQYVYRPLIDESKARRSVMSEITELTDRLFAGDIAAVVNHLLSAKDVKADDLARVREMIDRKAASLDDEKEQS